MSQAFRFIDLFSGLGGFHLAASSLGGHCVFASEINENLHGVYEQNYGVRPSGDLRLVDPSMIPDHDLLCAGFPCQPFSKAGGQKGWRDTVRGTLFFNIAQIIELKSPKYVILENVANFLKHDGGNTYRQVIQALNELGYEVAASKLSPHQFGVPQHRERMFIVAVRSSLGSFTWPKPTHEPTDIAQVLDDLPAAAKPIPPHVIECLGVWQEFLDALPGSFRIPYYPIWSMEFGATYPLDRPLHKLKVKELQQYKGSFGISLSGMRREEIYKNLPSHALREVGFPSWKVRFIENNRRLFEENRTALEAWVEKIKGFHSSLQKLEWNNKDGERSVWSHLIQARASGLRVKKTTCAPALVAASDSQIPIVAWKRRYLSVRECSRLQSMESLIMPESVYDAYEALGNAVNVHVVKLIMQNLLLSGESVELEKFYGSAVMSV
ncbi:DNA (cytosine-5-)-methyltransferase [Pseudomonas sp. ITEM 17296]|uniref:DNA cytosine methyltransferase n=1 Tax=Pseudomonas sp. ITEM 17296 TaxID=2790281 RepID=UPI0023809D16|nr:DNA (cytosine-5-)-methyltransferase [Pseudomonas sp. ITEM 17296]MDE4537703.1 DNA (cytosine-5-)-methyltransferase [Pseudomonas sp. ITEM 17296]